MKYRRELTPNIKFQTDRIFVRNDLFEQLIKSCKATNTEFLMLKEKLGICLCEENYYEEEIIKIQGDTEETDKEPIEVIDKVSNKKSTFSFTELREISKKYEMCKESNKELNKKSNKELNKKSNKESNKELIETSLKSDENTTFWYDKNKFNKILTTIDSNNFNHKNKIGKFKFYDINNLINNTKNNTISEANARKKINELNKIKKSRNKR